LQGREAEDLQDSRLKICRVKYIEGMKLCKRTSATDARREAESAFLKGLEDESEGRRREKTGMCRSEGRGREGWKSRDEEFAEERARGREIRKNEAGTLGKGAKMQAVDSFTPKIVGLEPKPSKPRKMQKWR